jgi:hypothetical protein
MTGEQFDLTKLVKSFDLTMESKFSPMVTDGENLQFFHEYKFPSIDINLTFENSSVATAARRPFTDEDAKRYADMFNFARRHVMKMEHRGRFWFDRASDTEVIMKELTLQPDGSFSATYESMSINDKTDYRPLARFLRWILRR